MSLLKKVRKANDAIAVGMTRAFGTMWMCYAFMIYGLFPLIAAFHPYQDTFLYWSNYVQLWSLPLILVGTNLLGRDADRRAELDHERLAKTYNEQVETNKQVMQSVQMIHHLMQEGDAEDNALQTITSKLDELRKRYDLLMPAANEAFQSKHCDCTKGRKVT